MKKFIVFVCLLAVIVVFAPISDAVDTGTREAATCYLKPGDVNEDSTFLVVCTPGNSRCISENSRNDPAWRWCVWARGDTVTFTCYLSGTDANVVLFCEPGRTICSDQWGNPAIDSVLIDRVNTNALAGFVGFYRGR